MTGLLVPAATGVAGAVLTTLYWRRRLATVERGRATSDEWDRLIEGFDPDENADSEARALLNNAASKADTPPEELPDRIEERTEKLRERHARIDSMREGWVNTYLRALETEPPGDGPRVVTVALDGGTHDDARAFAIHALETDDEVVIAVGRDDGTFAVGVNQTLVDAHDLRADDLAAAIADDADGGAGGMATLATGGARDLDTLLEAAQTSGERIRRVLEQGRVDELELT